MKRYFYIVLSGFSKRGSILISQFFEGDDYPNFKNIIELTHKEYSYDETYKFIITNIIEMSYEDYKNAKEL